MKFNEGYMVTSGDATKYYIVEAVEHVLLRQVLLSFCPHFTKMFSSVRVRLVSV